MEMIGMWWVGGRFESACNGIRVFFCFLFLLKIPFKSPCRAFWCGVRSNGKGRQLITLNKSFLSYQLWNTLSASRCRGHFCFRHFIFCVFFCDRMDSQEVRTPARLQGPLLLCNAVLRASERLQQGYS